MKPKVPPAVLQKHYSWPPPDMFRRKHREMRVGELTITLDTYGNASVFIPGNPARLTELQSALIHALERAAGWNNQSTKENYHAAHE